MENQYWIGWAAGSWGSSWGDHEVEENPQYYGSGGRRWQFPDTEIDGDPITEADVEKAWELVEAKRQARQSIEAATAKAAAKTEKQTTRVKNYGRVSVAKPAPEPAVQELTFEEATALLLLMDD